MGKTNSKITLSKALMALLSGLGICVAAFSGPPNSSASTQQIVDQFFPTRLHSAAAGFPAWALENQFSAFAVVEVLPNGDPRTIIAAYSNGLGGALRVIQAQPDSTYALAFEPTGLDFGGTDVEIRAVTIDQSGLPTALVSFEGVRPGSGDWIFRWDGTTLINLTPMEEGWGNERRTVLSLVKFADLDHDGNMEVISRDEDPPPIPEEGEEQVELPTAAETIYRLTPSGYVLDRPLLYFGKFTRKTSTPVSETAEFSLLKTSVGPYLLKITNGDRDGSNRLSSGQIVLNGVTVVTPNMLNQGAEFLSIPVSLQAHNTLQVTLAAKPQGYLAITVEDTSPPPPPPAPPPHP